MALFAPSLSSSSWVFEQPLASTVSPAGVAGHWSMALFAPSLSSSSWVFEQPLQRLLSHLPGLQDTGQWRYSLRHCRHQAGLQNIRQRLLSHLPGLQDTDQWRYSLRHCRHQAGYLQNIRLASTVSPAGVAGH